MDLHGLPSLRAKEMPPRVSTRVCACVRVYTGVHGCAGV